MKEKIFKFENKEYKISAWIPGEKENSDKYKIRVFVNKEQIDYYKYDIEVNMIKDNNNLLEEIMEIAKNDIKEKKHLNMQVEYNKS